MHVGNTDETVEHSLNFLCPSSCNVTMLFSSDESALCCSLTVSDQAVLCHSLPTSSGWQGHGQVQWPVQDLCHLWCNS